MVVIRKIFDKKSSLKSIRNLQFPVDKMLSALLEKCIDQSDLVSRVLQIFVQYKMMQESVTEVMTDYFSTIQMSVLLVGFWD